MKKLFQVLAMLLPTTGYILIFQILFPPKYAQFNEVYSADVIVIDNVEDKNFDIYKPYQEKENYYIEIVSTSKIVITMQSSTSGEVYVNGTVINTTEPIQVEIKGNNILLDSKTEMTIQGAYKVLELNESTITDKITISIGTILGVLILLFVIRAKLPLNARITISLAFVTVMVFLLKTILDDMFWVLISADTGWLLSMGIEKMPSKAQKLAKANGQKINNFLGNV